MLLQCGELCKACKSECQLGKRQRAPEIECPACDGGGCKSCDDGFIRIEQCPKTLVNPSMVKAVNLASICGRGDWPVAGGLMDQAAWFVSLYQRWKSEFGRVEREQVERATRRTN